MTPVTITPCYTVHWTNSKGKQFSKSFKTRMGATNFCDRLPTSTANSYIEGV